MRRWLIAIAGLAVVAGALMIPVGGRSAEMLTPPAPGARSMDLSAYSDAAPGARLPLLFIHHSVGGRLLADRGPKQAIAESIWGSHPDGGGLRARLEDAGYEVHEASYGSAMGDATDLFDWLPKFRDHMDAVLRVDLNDRALPDGVRNRIVVFKSCYPQNAFAGDGQDPGDPRGPELTLANARATMRALLPVFAQHPDVLFVLMTTPPLAAPPAEPAWKWLAKTVLRKAHNDDKSRAQAGRARRFNDWLASADGWLQGYEGKNVVVFDYYHLLTGRGKSNQLVYPTGDGHDSHPSAVGQQEAAVDFLPLLNRAVRRAGLVP